MDKRLDTIISLFEKNYKKSKTYISPQQDKELKNLSSDEISLIYENPSIFFQASKSRIVLVHWICKYIREVFEKYNFSDIDITTESYEYVRTKFNTKAFNRVEFCKLFGCEKTDTLTYEDFIEYEQKYIEEYNKNVSEENQLSQIAHILIKKKNPKTNIVKEFNNIIKDEKQKKVLALRSNGRTLDEVGNEIKVTRERVRQIESKPRTAIIKWLNVNSKEIINDVCDGYVVDNKKLIKLFGKENSDIIKYCVISVQPTENNWYYIKETDTMFYDEKGEFINLLNSNVNKLKKDEKSSLSEFVDNINNNGYNFFTKDDAINYLSANNFNVFNDEIHYGKMTIAKAINLVSLDLPNKKIKITDKKELENFAKLINEKYDLKVKAGRALSTRIQDILIMVDKATYSSIDSLNIQEELIKKIDKYISKMDNDRISYSALYETFEEDLTLESNITNQYSLHGILKHYEEKCNYMCLRYYVCKKEISDTKSESYFKQLSEILLKEGPMSSEQIIEQIPEWNNMYIKYAMIYFPEIVQWDTNIFINLKSIKITDEQKQILTNILKEKLDNKYKYASSYIIYNEVLNKIPELLKDNNITDEKQLYYVVQYFFSDKYKFRKPHILDNDKIKESFTTDDLVKMIAGRTKVLNKKDLIDDLMTYYGPKNSSLSLSLQRVLLNYIRISQNEYVLKNKIELTETNKKEIEKLINEQSIKNEILIPLKINFDKFPEIGYKWTPWLLCGIVGEYGLGFKKVSIANNSSQHSITPFVKDSSKLETKDEVIAWLLDNDFSEEKTDDNIFNYIKNIGIYHANLTKEEILKKIKQ